jgi:hypothetical protein
VFPACRTSLAFALALTVACGRTGTGAERTPDAALDATPSQPTQDAAPLRDAALTDASSESTQDASGIDAEGPFLTGTPTSAKSIGHTSVVFKVELSTGRKAAFKPASRRGPLRYKGEVAAYRLARLLELPNVPPAFFRTLDARPLASAKGGGEMIVSNGLVKGALIPWIADLSFVALEQAPLSIEWKNWLKRASWVAESKRGRAREISTLVAFDYLTGNWDRWSGGNVGLDKATGSLLYIDNDGAFFEVAPEDGLQRNKKLLAGIDRFSRAFITRLRSLDDAAITQAIGDEIPAADGKAAVPLLSPRALAAMLKRRVELLDLVDAKLEAAGETETYFFP